MVMVWIGRICSKTGLIVAVKSNLLAGYRATQNACEPWYGKQTRNPQLLLQENFISIFADLSKQLRDGCKQQRLRSHPKSEPCCFWIKGSTISDHPDLRRVIDSSQRSSWQRFSRVPKSQGIILVKD